MDIKLADFPHLSAQKPPETVSEVETYIKKFSWGSIPPDPPNIMKLMSTTSFFTDGTTYYIVLPPP